MSHRNARIAVCVAALVCAVGTLFGTGVIGTRVEESSGGRLSAEATLIAPAGPAFSIWSVIYLGLFGYTLWQLLPVAGTARVASTRWPAAASMVLNAAWLLVTQAGWLEVSVLVMVALVVSLGVLAARLASSRPATWPERVVLDGTFGLYLGWVCVATCANIAATLVGRGMPATGTGPELATLVVLLVATGLGWFLARRLGGPVTVAVAVVVAMAWGLGWVGFGRIAGEPASMRVGVAAVVAAVAVLLAVPAGRLADRSRRSTASAAAVSSAP